MKSPFSTLSDMFREMIEDFREEYPGGIREYIQEVRKDRAENRAAHRRWKKLTPEEQPFNAIILEYKAHRAAVTDGFIFTEEVAHHAMRALHGNKLNYVEYDNGVTAAILKDGRIIRYDEAARRIS